MTPLLQTGTESGMSKPENQYEDALGKIKQQQDLS